jgi:hypothetical protein
LDQCGSKQYVNKKQRYILTSVGASSMLIIYYDRQDYGKSGCLGIYIFHGRVPTIIAYCNIIQSPLSPARVDLRSVQITTVALIITPL